MGYDPLYYNPGDPWERPMNHPRFVQSIVSILNFNQDHTTFIGILLILLFFVGIFLFLKKIDQITALMLAVVIFSPSVVLGIERANHDLFIFFLVSLALFASNLPIISMFILLFASFIKLFPVFALSYFFKYSKKTQIVIYGCFITFFLIYMLVNYSDWPQVFNSTQKGYGVKAYGVRTYDPSSSLKSYIPLIGIIISSLLFYAKSIHKSNPEQEETNYQRDTNYIDAFRAGAGIYVGTFFLGYNWAYRLMFLIFTIPQLVSWRKDAKKSLKSLISLIALICIIISCWSMLGRGIIPNLSLRIIDETSNWFLFASLFYLLIASMPLFWRTKISQVASPFSKNKLTRQR